jgi:hypothetical protein
MSTASIECPECGWKLEVEEAALGQPMKCPKCKESFVAEKPGLYDFVDSPEPASTFEPPVAPAPRSSPGNRRASGPPKKEEEVPLSDEEKSDLLSSMEKWAAE